MNKQTFDKRKFPSQIVSTRVFFVHPVVSRQLGRKCRQQIAFSRSIFWSKRRVQRKPVGKNTKGKDTRGPAGCAEHLNNEATPNPTPYIYIYVLSEHLSLKPHETLVARLWRRPGARRGSYVCKAGHDNLSQADRTQLSINAPNQCAHRVVPLVKPTVTAPKHLCTGSSACRGA